MPGANHPRGSSAGTSFERVKKSMIKAKESKEMSLSHALAARGYGNSEG
jgi:hypothetical protein